MTYPDDSLDPLFIPKNQFSAPSFRTGVLEEWNPDTFANIVNVDGARLQNLPVMNGIEALSFTSGIPVSLLGQSGTGALTAYAILGRYIQPGTDATAKAIQALQTTVVNELLTELVEALLTSPEGQDLAAFVFSQRVFTDYIQTQQTTTSLAYTDLATVGPTVTNVPISSSGKAVVLLSALVEASTTGGAGAAVSLDMGFEISGATSVSPGSLGQFLMIGNFDSGTTTSNSARMGIAAAVEGLNEGLHTFQAKYRRVQGSNPVPFAERTIVVFAL